MTNIQEDLQDKVKIRVLNTPPNMQGELVIDFKNSQSLTLTLYPKFREVDTFKGGVYKVDGIKVVDKQQPAIVGCATGWGTDQDDVARTAINSVIVALRNHWLIDT